MLSGVSIWQLLILLVIVVLIFGTRRLGSMGGDLGAAIRNFRSAMSDEESAKPTAKSTGTLPGSSSSADQTADRVRDETHSG